MANALYWLQEYHIDGLRVDAVASMLYLDYSRPADGWTPNVYGGRENLEAVQFLQEMNATVHKMAPGIVTVAEESTSWPGVTRPTNLGGLGFSMKWNMGWMNDTLDYISRDPIYRNYHHHEMTFSMLYAFSENYVLPISHDEVVHGKGTLWGRMPGNDHVKAAGAAQPAGLSVGPPGQAVAVHGPGVRPACGVVRGTRRRLVPARREQLLHRHPANGARYQRHLPDQPALWSQDTKPEGYSWIDANDSANNVLSFLRFGSDGSVMACVFNFSGAEHSRYRLGLPHAGRVARDPEHRRHHLQRLGHRQYGRRGRHRRAVARPARVGDAGAATDVGTVAGPRITQQPLTLRVRFVSTIRERAVRDGS